jgi:ADP-heptose:LPS heptosyltransferase
MKSQGRILLIRGGAIGDFILTLPVLSALRSQFPETHLEVLGYPHIASLARLGGLADSVKPLESSQLAGFFGRPDVLDPDWSAYFQSFHVVLSYLFDPDNLFQTNIRRTTQAQFITGPHRPQENSEEHATNQLLQPLERLAIFDPDPVPRLPLKPRDPEQVLVLHPGSGSEKKNWPEFQWVKLLAWILTETGLKIKLVGGEAEGDRLERLSTRYPRDRVETVRSKPLTEVAEIMASSLGFVGHDSGLSHLGAAVGRPGLVLWGPSQERVWRPRSNRVLTLRHRDGLNELPLEVVQEQLGEALMTWNS